MLEQKVWNLRSTLGDPCAHLKYQTVVSLSPNEASLMRFAYRVNRRAGLITQPPSMDEGDQNDDDALPYKRPRVMSIGHRQVMRLHCCPLSTNLQRRLVDKGHNATHKRFTWSNQTKPCG